MILKVFSCLAEELPWDSHRVHLANFIFMAESFQTKLMEEGMYYECFHLLRMSCESIETYLKTSSSNRVFGKGVMTKAIRLQTLWKKLGVQIVGVKDSISDLFPVMEVSFIRSIVEDNPLALGVSMTYNESYIFRLKSIQASTWFWRATKSFLPKISVGQ